MLVNGEKFKISNGVIIEVEHDLPIVGVISQIDVVNGDVVALTTDKFHTSFDPHYRAYVLDKTPFSSGIILHSDLFIQHSLHIRSSHVYELSSPFVILSCALCVM